MTTEAGGWTAPGVSAAPGHLAADPGPDDIGEARSTSLPSSTVRRHLDYLLGGPAQYTIGELAERAGVSVDFARTFWRAMAFPNVSDDLVVFGEIDVEALRTMGALIDGGHLDETAVISLLRAQSHMTDRLVLWQTEALIEHAARQLDLDDASARLVVLGRLPRLVEVLEDQLAYAWRRQLGALMVRTETEVAEMGQPDTDPFHLPLQRALGFVDMVAYTRRSAELGTRALADLVQTFEYTSRDVITTRGARVVKTIGDAVLYVADDLPTAAEVAVDLLEALKARPTMLPVRASLVWGGVLSRNGDVFGPTVNLASRLVDVAPPGAILMDKATAEALAATPVARDYTMVPREVAELQGVGEVAPIELRRLPR